MDWKSKYFGDKKFYKSMLAIALPIIAQNGISNFINMLDNVMVGSVGTDQMSGVSIVNQLFFIFYLSIFGGLAGAGIFVAQFFGNHDNESIKSVVRIKLIIGACLLIGGCTIVYLFQDQLINFFLHEGSETGNIEQTLYYAKKYLAVMLVGMIPFVICQCFTSTLRETGETVLPMKAGIIAVFVNLGLNYVLIFGKFGAPELGVVGAAIATNISRVVECLIVVVWSVRNKERFPFMFGILKNFNIDGRIARNVIVKGLPLLVNEFLWSSSVTMLAHCYSTRGLAAVAGINICNTLNGVFNIVMIAFGDAIAIVVGQQLGAGEFETAKTTSRRMRVFSFFVCMCVGLIMLCFAPFFPQMYKTTAEVKHLATQFIAIMAVMMPFCAYANASYFTMRSGGKTLVTFLFDSVYAWVFCVPLGLILAYKTAIPVVFLYMICQGAEIIKCIIAFILVRKDIWIQNLTK